MNRYPSTTEEWYEQYQNLIKKIDEFEPIELIDPNENINEFMADVLNIKWIQSSHKRRKIIALLHDADNLKLIAEKWRHLEHAKKVSEARSAVVNGERLYPNVIDREAYATLGTAEYLDMILSIDLAIAAIKALNDDMKQLRHSLENVGHNFRNWNK